MIKRAAVVVALALVVVGLFALDDPNPTPPPAPSPVIGASVDPSARSATWYCAAGVEASAGGVEHQLVISNPGEKTTARITGFRDPAGGTDAELAAAKPSSIRVELAARSLTTLPVSDVGAGVGGVTVETSGASAGSVTVAHRMLADTQSDQSTCLTEASSRWYFASGNTELGTSARLWLLNPFAGDASVDIAITTENGTRVPGGDPGQDNSFRGVIVPAGTAKVIDLGQGARVRTQFSVTVRAVGGRVAAEMTQSVKNQGLRMSPGVPRLSTTWAFADSTGGTEVDEQLHILNPSRRAVTVRVSVMPNQDRESFPEPFLIDVPARHFATVPISAEGRVNPDISRWIRVDSVTGPGVAVMQVVVLTGPGNADGSRPSVAGGLASSSGSSAAATDWYVTSLDPGPDSQSVVVLANPSETGIALVDISRITGGDSATIAEQLEVPPMGSLAVDLTEAAGPDQLSVRVRSRTPILVSGRTTSSSLVEVATFPAVPSLDGATTLPGS
jgi:hypothetical protein